jgi:putative flippase GtrA
MNVRNSLQRVTRHAYFKSGLKLGSFLTAGLPAFALALPLNWMMVVRLKWHESLAYALIMVFQTTVNFFMCRRFVFTERKETSLWTQFGQFLAGILFFRLADWCLYSILVTVAGVNFLAVQVLNVILFAVLKFKFSQKVMERPAESLR